jgi:integrase-like protein
MPPKVGLQRVADDRPRLRTPAKPRGPQDRASDLYRSVESNRGFGADRFGRSRRPRRYPAGKYRSCERRLDQRTYTVGPCKNAAAYRVVLLVDREGKEAMRLLKKFLGGNHTENSFVFHSRNGSPLREINVLVDGLHPALRAVGLPQVGMHAFRHGCNRRWELAGLNPAVIRQFMGHSSSAMTARYTGEIQLEAVRAATKLRVVTKCDKAISGGCISGGNALAWRRCGRSSMAE